MFTTDYDDILAHEAALEARAEADEKFSIRFIAAMGGLP